MYIIPGTLSEEEAGVVETKISTLVTKYGATVESTKRLGKFRLAYLIDEQRHGYYMLVRFNAERTAMAKIDENLRISTDIVRHMILRAEEAGEGKYNLVEYKEINLDNKEDRPRRRTDRPTEDVKAVEGEKTEEGEKKPEASLPEVAASV